MDLVEFPRVRVAARTRRLHAPIRQGGELERRLYQAELRYRALAERLPIVAYVCAMDVQGSFTDISPQIEALSGFKPEEWLADNRLWLRRMHPEDRRRILPILARAHRGDRFQAEYRIIDRAGHARWVRDESRVIRDEAGSPLFIQGTLTEITDRKQRERESAGQGRELMLSRSENEQFISIASHELKAPLRRIVNLGELLASRCRGRLKDEEKALLGRMIESAATLQGLVASLADYAQTGSEAPLSEVDLGAAVEHVLQGLNDEISTTGARITVGPLPTVLAESGLLERVLWNLLDNAIKFRGDDPPRIHISAARSGTDWVVSIRDNGIGIHPRQAERIFSILQRLQTGREHAGAGLGLAVCRKIIERFGGRIWVESQLGEGATFHFTLQTPVEGGPS